MKIIEAKRKETAQAITFLVTIEFTHRDLQADSSNPNLFRQDMTAKIMSALSVVAS
jgi:hypothetical protein